MDDVRTALRAPSMLAPAKVARQFAGSRIEQQVLTQVFDVIWQAGRSRPWLKASDPVEFDWVDTATLAAARLSREGGIS